MPETQAFPVVTKSGRRGRVFRKARFLDRNESNRVELDDGTELNVTAAALAVQPDGSFLLDDAAITEAARQAPAARTEPPREAAARQAPPAPQPAASPPRAEPPRDASSRPPAVAQAAVNPHKEQRVSEDEVVHTMPNKTDEPFTVSDPLFTEDVHVEKVAVNRILNAPVQVRQEGDVTVIPVIEEVITVQKRLLLREEIRITRRRKEIREPRRIIIDAGEPRTYGADGRVVETSA